MPPKYKPGGKRFQPQGKSKTLPKQVINDSSSTSPDLAASGALDQEAENQFELELCWCIQQLQISLESGKLGEKQSLEGAKTMNLLKSDTVALIRKRQAMRNAFGDYRAQMIQDEKTHGKYVSRFKFSSPKVDGNKSMFLRKVMKGSDTKDTLDNEIDNKEKKGENECKKMFIMSKESSDEPFRFNFNVPECK